MIENLEDRVEPFSDRLEFFIDRVLPYGKPNAVAGPPAPPIVKTIIPGKPWMFPPQHSPNPVSVMEASVAPKAISSVSVNTSPAEVASTTVESDPKAPISISVGALPEAPSSIQAGFKPVQIGSVSVDHSPAAPSISALAKPVAPTNIGAFIGPLPIDQLTVENSPSAPTTITADNFKFNTPYLGLWSFDHNPTTSTGYVAVLHPSGFADDVTVDNYPDGYEYELLKIRQWHDSNNDGVMDTIETDDGLIGGIEAGQMFDASDRGTVFEFVKFAITPSNDDYVLYRGLGRPPAPVASVSLENSPNPVVISVDSTPNAVNSVGISLVPEVVNSVNVEHSPSSPTSLNISTSPRNIASVSSNSSPNRPTSIAAGQLNQLPNPVSSVSAHKVNIPTAVNSVVVGHSPASPIACNVTGLSPNKVFYTNVSHTPSQISSVNVGNTPANPASIAAGANPAAPTNITAGALPNAVNNVSVGVLPNAVSSVTLDSSPRTPFTITASIVPVSGTVPNPVSSVTTSSSPAAVSSVSAGLAPSSVSSVNVSSSPASVSSVSVGVAAAPPSGVGGGPTTSIVPPAVQTVTVSSSPAAVQTVTASNVAPPIVAPSLVQASERKFIGTFNSSSNVYTDVVGTATNADKISNLSTHTIYYRICTQGYERWINPATGLAFTTTDPERMLFNATANTLYNDITSAESPGGNVYEGIQYFGFNWPDEGYEMDNAQVNSQKQLTQFDLYRTPNTPSFPFNFSSGTYLAHDHGFAYIGSDVITKFDENNTYSMKAKNFGGSGQFTVDVPRTWVSGGYELQSGTFDAYNIYWAGPTGATTTFTTSVSISSNSFTVTIPSIYDAFTSDWLRVQIYFMSGGQTYVTDNISLSFKLQLTT